MIVREFSVWTFSSQSTGKISKFSVDDCLTKDDTRPSIADFPISILYPEDVQRARAQEYATYMNRIVKATRDAYSENLLADKLKGTL